jgi:uncharacterized protein (DUF111 family)
MHKQGNMSDNAGNDNILIFAQVDSVSGDSMAYAMTSLYDAGAHNVNLVPSLTKKGRPGYLLIIDTSIKAQSKIEDILVAELGLLGWRLLASQHVSLEVEVAETDLVLEVLGKSLALKVPTKRGRTSDGRTLESIDYQYCVEVKRRLWEELNTEITLRELRTLLWSAVIRGENRVTLDIEK